MRNQDEEKKPKQANKVSEIGIKDIQRPLPNGKYAWIGFNTDNWKDGK